MEQPKWELSGNLLVIPLVPGLGRGRELLYPDSVTFAEVVSEALNRVGRGKIIKRVGVLRDRSLDERPLSLEILFEPPVELPL